ncbi:hypothetical protein CAPTEDRAFT_111702 [Capitella teleta]|nr:hypothetical protein CAPTEDRAFT_111702 [Capitella teleta]|eukprot:ELT94435.1 hypothetical protein CAPTEDRAFT_111702 [Capitella teleta]
MDNDSTNDEKMVDMIGDDTGREVTLPAFFLLGRDGFMIKRALERMDLPGAIINIPINATGIPPNQLNQPPWTLW